MRRWIVVAGTLLLACAPAPPSAAPPAPQPSAESSHAAQHAASDKPATNPGSASASTASTAASSSASSSAPSARPHASAAPTAPAPPAIPPPLPRDTVVLHVGDSMADALGKDLKKELEARGIKNPLHYKEATYIPEWAGPKWQLSEHLARYNPDLVIVTLGGNEVAMPDPTVRADPVRRIVKKIGDRPCIWVAAPLWPGAPHTGILKVVKDNCAPCIYVDTNELMTPMEVLGDKIHPTLKERKRWAKFMVRWLLQNRDPKGERPWTFLRPTSAPPAESEAWLQTR